MYSFEHFHVRKIGVFILSAGNNIIEEEISKIRSNSSKEKAQFGAKNSFFLAFR
jgi:hypothetical protein